MIRMTDGDPGERDGQCALDGAGLSWQAFADRLDDLAAADPTFIRITPPAGCAMAVRQLVRDLGMEAYVEMAEPFPRVALVRAGGWSVDRLRALGRGFTGALSRLSIAGGRRALSQTT